MTGTPIDPRIHDALDGGLAREALSPEMRRAVERLEAAARLLAAPPAGSVEARVMAAIRRPAPSRLERLICWLRTPRAVTLRFRPAWSLAAALAAAAAIVVTSGEEPPAFGEHEGVAQFVARFPGARSVHVVGSFNDWRTGTIPLDDPDHDGVWRAAVVLPVGTYEYMFLVDGERWVPDHLAERLVADDFGRENSVVIVRPVRR
jgi:hypothetical protein